MNIRFEDWEAEQMQDPEFRTAVEELERRQMIVDRADQTHDWVTGVELPWCKACGLSKISAHIWGDDDWTKEPIACLITTTTSTTTVCGCKGGDGMITVVFEAIKNCIVETWEWTVEKLCLFGWALIFFNLVGMILLLVLLMRGWSQ